jgi:membrane-associated phospholipid phosphatase
MIAAARWAATRWRAQVLLYASAYGAYSGARWLSVHDVREATAHARWIERLETAVHVSVERPMQRALDAGAPIWLLNHLYLVAQLVVVPGALIWLYARAPAIYRGLRNTVLATWLIAVPIYALFPVAPPRLAGIGIADTITAHSAAGLNSHLATSFYNPFAAVPSLHVGFAFAVAIALAAAARRRWAKAAALLWGPAVTLAVVVTGNHFVFDVAAGLLVTAVAFVAVRTGPRAMRALAEATRAGLTAGVEDLAVARGVAPAAARIPRCSTSPTTSAGGGWPCATRWRLPIARRRPRPRRGR